MSKSSPGAYKPGAGRDEDVRDAAALSCPLSFSLSSVAGGELGSEALVDLHAAGGVWELAATGKTRARVT
jgi:hypothetical protein